MVTLIVLVAGLVSIVVCIAAYRHFQLKSSRSSRPLVAYDQGSEGTELHGPTYCNHWMIH